MCICARALAHVLLLLPLQVQGAGTAAACWGAPLASQHTQQAQPTPCTPCRRHSTPGHVRRCHSGAAAPHSRRRPPCLQVGESIRGCDVFLIQPTTPPVNDNMMELLIMVRAARQDHLIECTLLNWFQPLRPPPLLLLCRWHDSSRAAAPSPLLASKLLRTPACGRQPALAQPHMRRPPPSRRPQIDACKRASARSITAVLPYFGYARADRKTQVSYGEASGVA